MVDNVEEFLVGEIREINVDDKLEKYVKGKIAGACKTFISSEEKEERKKLQLEAIKMINPDMGGNGIFLPVSDCRDVIYVYGNLVDSSAKNKKILNVKVEEIC